MKYNALFFAMAASLLLLNSCSKEDNSNSADTQASLSYKLQATNVSSTNLQRIAGGGRLVWMAGYANPKMIKFEAKQQGTQIEYKSTNTATIDLFSTAAISFGGFVLPPGNYKEIELKVTLDDEANTPALHLEGTYTDNIGTLPVVLDVYDQIEVKTEVKDVDIDANTSVAAVTDLDLAMYTSDFTELLLRRAALTNGVLVISKTSNKSLYNMIVNNMRGHRHHCRYDKHR